MSEVLTEVRDGVLIITLNRPEAKNAANRALAEGVAAALDTLDGADTLRVGIITSVGAISRRGTMQGAASRKFDHR